MIAESFPNDPLGQKLCAIFSYRWMSLEGSTTDATNPDWRTITKYPLRPRALWNKWRDPKKLVGTRFDDTTQHALIDLDKYSKFNNIDGVDTIQAALETIGIVRTIPIRSSWSGGKHLYCPLPHEVNTFDLACAIRYTLEAQEIFIEPGQVEIFPNTKTYVPGKRGVFSEYHGHRLPLQYGSGSALLDHDLNPAGASLKEFFVAWDNCAISQDMELLEIALKQGRELHKKRPKQSRATDEWRKEWALEIETGWTAPGQTNDLLRVISGYGRVFEGLSGQELHVFVLHSAITAPGFEEYCNHQEEIERRALDWSIAAEKYYWPLGAEPQRDKNAFSFNAGIASNAQERIKAACEWLKQCGKWPKTVTAQVHAIAERARASLTTIYKYAHLWKPLKEGVIDQSESDSADLDPQYTDPPNPVKPFLRKALHTTREVTKGGPLKSTLEKPFKQGKEGFQRGEKGFPQARGTTWT